MDISPTCHDFAYEGVPSIPEGMTLPAYRRSRGGRRGRAGRRHRAWIAAGWPLSRRPAPGAAILG
jgi:hypothetical protein